MNLVSGITRLGAPFCVFGEDQQGEVLLLPGMTDSFRDAKVGARMLKSQFSLLAESYRVHILSRPDSLDLESVDRAIEEPVLDYLSGISRKVNLMGVSMGGMLAQKIALSNPTAISRAVFAITGPVQPPASKERMLHWQKLAKNEEFETLQEETLSLIYGKKPSVQGSLKLKVQPPRSFNHFLACTNYCMQHNQVEGIKDLSMKVQWLLAEHDSSFPPDFVVEKIPESQDVKIVPEGVHGIVGLTGQTIQKWAGEFFSS